MGTTDGKKMPIIHTLISLNTIHRHACCTQRKYEFQKRCGWGHKRDGEVSATNHFGKGDGCPWALSGFRGATYLQMFISIALLLLVSYCHGDSLSRSFNLSAFYVSNFLMTLGAGQGHTQGCVWGGANSRLIGTY